MPPLEAGARPPTDTTNGTHKRKRESEANAEIMVRRADAETALEVDIMILDFQAYTTTMALLDSANFPTRAVSDTLTSNITATDAFLMTFRKRYPTYAADLALRFRLLLLRFCTLLVRRFTFNEGTPTSDQLQTLRTERMQHVRKWIAHRERVPSINYDASLLELMPSLTEEQLRTNRSIMLQSVGVESEVDQTEYHYGSAASVSLLDLLPMFMQVCALPQRTRQMINVTARAQLMTEFMLQASLEQYLVYGCGQGSDPIDDAFAWGCFLRSADNSSDSESDNSNEDKESGADSKTGHVNAREPAPSPVSEHDGNPSDESPSRTNERISANATSVEQRKQEVDTTLSEMEIDLTDHDTNHTGSGKSGLNDGIGNAPDSYDDISAHGLIVDSTNANSVENHLQDSSPHADSDRYDLTELEQSIDSMFRDPTTGNEDEMWTSAKRFVLDELLEDMPNADSALSHLEQIARLHSPKDFDASLRSFLRDCAQLIDLPMLVQIERGELAGMSKPDTQAFLRRCGLSASGRLL